MIRALLKRWPLHAPCAAALVSLSVLTGGLTLSARGEDAGAAALLARYHRPADTPAPADNPTTPAKVELGRTLFFDPRLSGSGAISCASCHNPSLGWQDGLAKGVGNAGGRLGRRTPTILNAAWVEPLFWDGRAASLEEQAKGPLAAPAEMNMPHAEVVRVVRAASGYAVLFDRAFPGQPIDIDTVAKAIAAYERTIVSAQAPFDRWVQGDETAITPAARRGFVLFAGKAKCGACHRGWRMTDDGFHDIGLADDDRGRGKLVAGLPGLEHAFKTPTLRNIAERTPYMHDGSLPSLEAVVDHYDQGLVARASLAPEIKPLGLTADEKADLVAFLRTLSSHDTEVALPTLPR
jgi:cytochrome c peroxidase